MPLGILKNNNTEDTNFYINLCTKIAYDNTLSNCGNTRKNYSNTYDKLCQLKLNDIDCHVNCRVGFDI